MSDDSSAFRFPLWDWPTLWKGSIPNPLDLIAAPQNLIQPILPGSVFGGIVNVNETNSNSPETERDIVSTQSYGKQLGCIIEVLAAVINELPSAGRETAPFVKFEKLRQDINRAKIDSSAKRLDRVASDLQNLKTNSPAEYERIAARLRDALKNM